MEDNATQGLTGAELWVGGGTVANLFAADSVLLVIEGEHCGFDLHNIIQVMQRG